MKRQTCQFTVEVKRGHGNPKKERSIWGNLDMASLVASTMRDLGQGEQRTPPFIDSGAASIDVAGDENPPVEHNMPDPQEAETVETLTEAPAAVEAPEPKKRAPRPKKAKSAPKQRIAREAVKAVSKVADAEPAPTRGKRKIYSQKERAQILAQIEKAIGRNVSVKAAAGETGISEQTYYQWKKAAETTAPADELKDLLALEEENKRLKKQLAERLRQENAELRKKLGLK